MSRFYAILLTACCLAASVRPAVAEDSATTYRYQGFDADGRACRGSSFVLLGRGGDTIGTYREDGEKERRTILTDEGGRLRARVSGPIDGMEFSAVFAPAEGRVLVRSESAAKDWKPGLRDGSSSLFFILPRLFDLRAGKSRATFTIIREEDGQRIAFAFECRGLERISVGGVDLDAYEVRMELADGLLRLFWPYSYRYYFRASDLILVRYEGPDARRLMERLDLVMAEESRLALASSGGTTSRSTPTRAP